MFHENIKIAHLETDPVDDTLWFTDASGKVLGHVDTSRQEPISIYELKDKHEADVVWKLDMMTNRGLTRPAFYGNYVVVGDKEGYLHWIDTDIGSFVARPPCFAHCVLARCQPGVW